MNSEFKLYEAIKLFNKDMFKILDNYPKKHRVLKDRIESYLLDLISATNGYNISRDKNFKLNKLYEILVLIANINYLIEISYDNRYMSKGQYVRVGNTLIELRKMSYSLINYVKEKL